jgi:hypothetical protein
MAKGRNNRAVDSAPPAVLKFRACCMRGETVAGARRRRYGET